MENYRLDLIVFFNSKTKNVILLDYDTDNPKCFPDIGCEIEPRYDWETNNKDLLLKEGIDFYFNIDKAFNATGIYKAYGYESSYDTPDGYYSNHIVDKVELIKEINY